MEEVTADLRKLKEAYPPEVKKEGKKPTLCPICGGMKTLYKTQSQGMWKVKCRGGTKKNPCDYSKNYKISNQPNEGIDIKDLIKI